MDAFTVSLSKTVSHALRHAPEQYDLRPDSDGWVDVAVLLDALRTRRRQWKLLREDDLIRMNAALDKRRFELRGGKIRALIRPEDDQGEEGPGFELEKLPDFFELAGSVAVPSDVDPADWPAQREAAWTSAVRDRR